MFQVSAIKKIRNVSSALVAFLALSGVEHTGGASFSIVSAAQADALPSVWQNKAKKLAQNILKSRQSLASDAATILGDAFKKKQFGDRIENYRAVLGKIPEADDPILTTAKEQFAALEKEFAAAQAGGSAAAAPAPAPTPSTTSSTTSTATTSTPAVAPPAADVRPLVSGERVRVKKMTRDINNVLGDLVTEGPSPLQDPLIVDKYTKRLRQFTDALKKYPQADDPDVIAARKSYLKLRESLQREFARAKAQKEKLGDVFARLREIQGRGEQFPVPKPLSPPFTEADAAAWLDAGSKATTAAQFDFKQLKEMGPIAYLPQQTVSGRMAEFDFRDIGRLMGAVAGRFEASQAGYPATVENIDRALATHRNQIVPPLAYDQAEKTARVRAKFGDLIGAAESRIHLETVLKRDDEVAKAKAAVAAIKAEREAYDKQRDALIDAVRMPKPGMTDPELLAIAKEIVERPKYEFGEHGPIIINSKKVTEREMETSDIDIDNVDVSSSGDITMSGTKTTYFYKWKEYQFATPLKEEGSDLWRIWYITAKFYESGGPTTPIGEWISGKVVESDLIRAENIDP